MDSNTAVQILAGAMVSMVLLEVTLIVVVLKVLQRLMPVSPGKQATLKHRLSRLGEDISEQAAKLRDAILSVEGEAKAESEGLISRAEKLTSELKDASRDLAATGVTAKDQMLAEVKPLMGEGAEVMKELEDLTRKLAGSVKDKLSSKDDAEEAQKS